MSTGLAETLSPEIIAAYHDKNFSAQVIGVTGGKGGVGKTTVAVNLLALWLTGDQRLPWWMPMSTRLTLIWFWEPR